MNKTHINLIIVFLLVGFSLLSYITPTIITIDKQSYKTNLFEKYFTEILVLQVISLVTLFLVNMFTKKEILNGKVVENTSPILQYSFMVVLLIGSLAGIGYMVKTYDIEQMTKVMFAMGLLLLFVFVLISDRDRQKQGKDSILIKELVERPLGNVNNLLSASTFLIEKTVRGTTRAIEDGYSYLSSDSKQKVTYQNINNQERYERPKEERYQQSRQERHEKPRERYESRPNQESHIPFESLDHQAIFRKIIEYLQMKGIRPEQVDQRIISDIATELGVSDIHIVKIWNKFVNQRTS